MKNVKEKLIGMEIKSTNHNIQLKDSQRNRTEKIKIKKHSKK